MIPMEMSPEFVQKMMLTPKMLLSMHVLQLNITGLRMFIRAEIEENPLLEEKEQDASLSEDKVELDKDLSMLDDEDIESQESFLSINEGVYGINEEKRRYLESLITKEESLYEHLRWQLQVLAEDDEQKRIGEFIIGNLDENGFLNMELEKMREEIGAGIECFKHALSLVRSFDPAGVGARNLKESLLIQLILSGKGDTYLYRVVYSHLEDLEKGNYGKITRALSISVEEVERAKRRISYLNPKPGANFSREEAVSIEPDVFLAKNNGAYAVQINGRDLPGLMVNRYYRSLLKDTGTPRETKEYIKKKVLNAKWVIDAVKKRKNTIIYVCGYLVDAQKSFLESGDIAVKPLTLRDAARELSVSEATVSRVVSNKYAQIYNRLFALKGFFAGRLKTANGDIISDRSVKQKIQYLIKEENPQHPLSDEAITSILNRKGIKISRRTVTKYRENLKVLPSYLRKKYAP